MADFLAKEPGGHAIARRLGANDPFIARVVPKARNVLASRTREHFADRAAYDVFTKRATADPEAIEYNKRAVSPDNPSQILGVRLVETFDL